MGLKFDGVKTLKRELDKYKQSSAYKLNLAVEAGAQAIIRRSQELVPVDTGNLKRSAYVTKRNNLSVVFGYAAEYALPRHERTELGQAKWLERAMDDFAYDAEDFFAKFINSL